LETADTLIKVRPALGPVSDSSPFRSERSAMPIPSSRSALANFLLRATAATVVFSASAAIADDQPRVSKAVGPQIVDAQKSLQSKDFQGAMTALKTAQANPDRKPYDDYIINRLIAQTAIGLNDMATAATAEEAAADSPAMPPDDSKALYHDALQLSAFVKQWPKTIEYGQRLIQLNQLDGLTAANLALAYYNTNDFAHAQQYAQQSIDLAKAAGQQPDQNALEIVMSSQVKQNNQAGAAQTLEQIAVATNTPDSWAQLVGVSFGAKGLSELNALYLYRLLGLADAMSGDDYKVMGSLASQLGYPTEAMNVLQKGVSSGKISSAQAGATLSKARHDADADQRALPQIAASADKSRTGEQDAKLGEDYWGYGRYGDAEAAAQRAVAKGGLKSPAEGPMLIGAAQVAQDKYADAVQSFSQVAGSAADMKTAHLWTLFAQAKQKTAPPAPASPTPAQ
jgi:hypothetical protein